jgi:uncharacterized membrane protein
MLVPLPIALWVFAGVADFLSYTTRSADWQLVAYYCLIGGVCGAALAAAAGFLDLSGLPLGPGRRTAMIHMIFNVIALLTAGANVAIRWDTPGHAGPRLLSLVTIFLIAISGWLGGELVYVHRVGVDPAVSRNPPH